MKSDTPRTDAVVAPHIGYEYVSVAEGDALLNHARQLERELNEANEKIAKLETDLSKSRSEANFWLNYP